MSYRKSTLLTWNNHKTVKGEKFIDSVSGLPYKTYIMYMSPFTQNSKGINLCPHASAGCSAACLFKSGMGGMYTGVQNGRINKTEWYLANRPEFMLTLDKEIGLAVKRHMGSAIVTIRLNGTSDIRFEKIKVRDNKNLFELYPDVQFYDYTKNPKRFDGSMPLNYDLTFSRSEVNHKAAMKLLDKGVNVAMVFNKIPETFEGYNVVSGDESDLRFLDPRGVIVGLKYKNNTGRTGKEANIFARESGFVIAI